MTNYQMTDDEMDQLGRAFSDRLVAAVESTPGQDLHTTWVTGHRRRNAKRATLGALAAVAAVAVAVPLAVAGGGSPSHVQVTASATPTVSTVAPRPAAALQQTLRNIAVPHFFTDEESRQVQLGNETLLTAPTAYSDDGGPALVLYEVSVHVTEAARPPGLFLSYDNEHPSSPYDGTPGITGTGVGLSAAESGSTNPVFVTPDYPAHGEQYYVWTLLPKGTAYVTYTYEGELIAWQNAVNSTIALLTPRPAAFDSKYYATARSATKGVLTAYDNDGTALASHPGSYITGDNGRTSGEPDNKPSLSTASSNP